MTKLSTLLDNNREAAGVSAQTEGFLKDAQWILKQRGFTRTDARKTSALFNWTFERGDRKIHLSGWHGTGKRGTNRWYGDLKALLDVHDNVDYIGTDKARYSFKGIFSISSNYGTVAEHTKMLQDALDYFEKA